MQDGSHVSRGANRNPCRCAQEGTRQEGPLGHEIGRMACGLEIGRRLSAASCAVTVEKDVPQPLVEAESWARWGRRVPLRAVTRRIQDKRDD